MQSIAPIIISSPVRRSGTTLLQRLLCSADNTLIYGENCANDFHFMAQFFISKEIFLSQGAEQRDDLLEKVLAGDVNDWIADLMPPVAEYQNALEKNCFNFLKHLADYAQEKGRNIWGLKMAEWSGMQIVQLQRRFPEMKLIYIRRNLLDCARSARRVNFHLNAQELQMFCQNWSLNYQHINQFFPLPNLLMIEYEDLIKAPKGIIAEMETFTGAKGIQASVLDQKINTFKSDLARAEDGSGYMAPGELNGEELALIAQWEKANQP